MLQIYWAAGRLRHKVHSPTSRQGECSEHIWCPHSVSYTTHLPQHQQFTARDSWKNYTWWTASILLEKPKIFLPPASAGNGWIERPKLLPYSGETHWCHLWSGDPDSSLQMTHIFPCPSCSSSHTSSWFSLQNPYIKRTWPKIVMYLILFPQPTRRKNCPQTSKYLKSLGKKNKKP